MVQVRVAHQGREYDIDMKIKGQPSASDVKEAVAQQLNLTPDAFTLKHEGSDLTDEFAKEMSSDANAGLELVCDQQHVGLREILSADDIPLSVMIEHLSMADMRQAENLLLHYFGKFGRVSRLFVQLDGSWQQTWSLVVFCQGTDMQAIPTSGSSVFSENSTTKLVASLEVAREGTAHVMGLLSDHFRHGKVEGQLGAAIMRNVEMTGNQRAERSIVRVIEENSPVTALRAWVVSKDEDDPFSVFAAAEERNSLSAAQQNPESRSRSSSRTSSEPSPPQNQGRKQPHPAIVHTRAMGGRILHAAAQDAKAASESPMQRQQQPEEQKEESTTGTTTMTLTHNSGCTCKNCQCSHNCVCDNCAHWSR